MDPKLEIAIVVAVVVVICLFLVRRTFTKGTFTASKSGVSGTLHGNPNAAPPAAGVDLAGAEFKDENEFTAKGDVRVKAPDMRAGSKNKFTFGEASPEETKDSDLPKN